MKQKDKIDAFKASCRVYLNEKEALKIYNSMKVAYFMTRKYLIHSEKGVLMKQVIK